MHSERSRLQQLLAPGVEAQGCELLGIQVSRGRRHSVLRLYIDRDQGVTLEDCERVSQQVSGLLDLEDPIGGAYHLEVSSPGDDRPLFERTHYERFVGHRVRVRMALAVNEQRSFTGELLGVTDANEVRLRDGDAEWLLPLEQVSSARLLPEAVSPVGAGGGRRGGKVARAAGKSQSSRS